ncbi:hypothetical protein F5Y18DRAFT_433144 [Xylariaceae sp. FL1019]|nr:hypothetical protein F5Y18DRAFT_433144 [Xylariaceae sp. FL1019]
MAINETAGGWRDCDSYFAFSETIKNAIFVLYQNNRALSRFYKQETDYDELRVVFGRAYAHQIPPSTGPERSTSGHPNHALRQHHREQSTPEKWTGPYKLMSFDGHDLTADINGPTKFRSTHVKPFYREDWEEEIPDIPDDERITHDHDPHDNDLPYPAEPAEQMNQSQPRNPHYTAPKRGRGRTKGSKREAVLHGQIVAAS